MGPDLVLAATTRVQDTLNGLAYWVLLIAAGGLVIGAAAAAVGSIAGHSALRAYGIRLVAAAVLGAICVGGVTAWVAWATAS